MFKENQEQVAPAAMQTLIGEQVMAPAYENLTPAAQLVMNDRLLAEQLKAKNRKRGIYEGTLLHHLGQYQEGQTQQNM